MFYFSESTIFKAPGVPKVVPGEIPGGPKWCPGAPETRKDEKWRPSYISACLLLPLPPSLSLRPQILGFFGGSLGPPGDFATLKGDPKIIQKSSKIHPRASSGPRGRPFPALGVPSPGGCQPWGFPALGVPSPGGSQPWGSKPWGFPALGAGSPPL